MQCVLFRVLVVNCLNTKIMTQSHANLFSELVQSNKAATLNSWGKMDTKFCPVFCLGVQIIKLFNNCSLWTTLVGCIV